MADPVFDAGVLSALSQKIQSDFKSGADPRKAAAKSKGKGKGKDKDKDKKDDGSTAQEPAKEKTRPRPEEEKLKGQKRKRSHNDVSDEPDLSKKPEFRKVAKQQQPKASLPAEAKPSKKTRSGFENGVKTARENRGPNRERSSGAKVTPQLDLRALVSDLGGDDDDLKLIEDVGSESEVEGEDEQGSLSLKSDIQDMIKKLGIPQAQQELNDFSEDDETTLPPNGQQNGGNEVDGEHSEEETEDVDDGESDSETSYEEPQLISQAKQALDSLPSRERTNQKGLAIEPQSEWHAISLPVITFSESDGPPISSDALHRLQSHAKELLDRENEVFAAVNKTSSSANRFYATIMSSGTLSDKISALTLSVQESPVHNVRTLESLVNLGRKRNRGQAVEVLGALKDLLGPGSLLPSDRRLRNFVSQPGLKFISGKELKSWNPSKPLPQPLTKAHMIVWAYEDWLKSTYFEVLKIMETWTNDEIVYTRGKAVDYIFELLRDKPEQEANLLRLLVNKLGDMDKQVSSKTSYHILQIENAHPAMKSLIISSIESDLIFRPHQSNHAKYYGIITLNQTILSTKEEAVARQLLNIYFALFVSFLQKPEADDDMPVKEVSKINSKGESQGGGSVPGKKAQKKAAAQARAAMAEGELREKMISAVLTGVNRAMPYLDKSSDFFDKHVDTLFRITHSANFNTSIQALMLIQQLSGTQQTVSNRFYRTLYESLLDPRLLTSSKQALYLNLLYRSLRSDLSVKRVKAFAKRLLQITAMQQPSFACAVVYLIRELESVFPSLTALVDQPEVDESDEEEVFRDVPDDLEGGERFAVPTLQEKHRPHYDGRKRDPEHAKADLSCLWELAPLQQHFHPSVSLFATSLSSHSDMPSKPDLSVNTLIHFLDRFVYRNPKKVTSNLRGHSLMQPLASSSDRNGLLVVAKDRTSAMQLPVNSERFKNKQDADVGADEVFFHRYFNEVGKKVDKAKKKREERKQRKDDDEAEAEDDEDEIWQALVNSRPEIEGDEGEDDDWDDMEDFEEAMDEDQDPDEVVDDGEDEQGQPDIEDDDEDDGFDFDDEDDLLGSDEDLPENLQSTGKEEQEDSSEDETKTEKKKKANKRKMLKSLPMFASADDYAAMLADEDEG